MLPPTFCLDCLDYQLLTTWTIACRCGAAGIGCWGASVSGRWCGVRRYLVVANQTLGGEELWEVIRERVARGDCHFHLVVPATPASQLDPGSAEAAGGDPEGADHE